MRAYAGLYTKKVLSHFRNPHNFGEIKKPDGLGKVGNIRCGDIMWLYIKVSDGRITDIKFRTYGCPAAIATSSMITDLVKGKTIKAALAITKEKLIERLGGLPPFKLHCSVLAVDALHAAIFDYLTKSKLPVPAALRTSWQRIQ